MKKVLIVALLFYRATSWSRSRTTLSKCGTQQTTTLSTSRRRNCRVNFKPVSILMSKFGAEALESEMRVFFDIRDKN